MTTEPPARGSRGRGLGPVLGLSRRSAQALGRLPWFDFFFLRARRLLPRFAMAHFSLM